MKYRSTFILICTLTTFLSQACIAQQKKTILAIFAHPDDEQSVSPVLAKYADAGVNIYVAIATDGRYGASEHFGVDDPDSLVAIRKDEITCMTSKLGINPPIMMGLHDQLRMQEGMDTMSLQLNAIKDEVIKLFNNLKPDIVITWGPSGMTGHPDHRMIGNVVTEVFSAKKWNKPSRLYYTELVSGSMPTGYTELSTVDISYLNVRIPVSKEYIEKARAAWDCYKSQYTPEGAKELQDLFWTRQKGISYFRSFTPTNKIQTTLFP
jgi:LmbE family N-acetylglucosaminyl deacetylase